MKYKLARFFYRVMLWWVAVWSATYRFFRQPLWKYKKSPLNENLTPFQAWEKVKVLEWREDDWTTFGNAINRPEHVQMTIDVKNVLGYQVDGPMDCDDYAVWCANVIDKKYDPSILVVSWQDSKGKMSGHAVCLVEDKEGGKFYHVGNWGLRGSFLTVSEVIHSIMGRDSKLVGWGVYTEDLKLINWGKEV